MPFDATPIETKPDVFSLASLVAWLEKQPADKTYDWLACDGTCLIDQYLTAALGVVSSKNYLAFLDMETRGDIACELPRTFGAALTRARSLIGVP